MIELRDIHKTFNQRQHNEFQALGGIDLEVRGRQVTALCGPSGSGKTSLLSIIGCLSRPTRGRVSLDGADISGLPERFLTDIRRRTFGFVFQQFNLIRGMSALENVMLPAYPLGGDWRTLRDTAAKLLDDLKMAARQDAPVEWLSGGEQQRVAIARALINAPRVIVADEPTANLDTALSMEFMAILERLVDQGITVLLSSHDPLVVKSSLVQRVVEMRDGRIVSASPMATEREEPV
jgi:putative ABC transport system ATP-binding protein